MCNKETVNGDVRMKAPFVLSGAVIFMVQEKPHPRFERQGDDLHLTVTGIEKGGKGRERGHFCNAPFYNIIMIGGGSAPRSFMRLESQSSHVG